MSVIPPASLGIDEIWQSVALEERLELISKSHAYGLIASLTCTAVLGCVAYGLDQISLLLVAGAGAFFAFPLFSSYVWRNGKPSLILAYLAVRTVARRYAYAMDLPNLEITLIFRGSIKEVFESAEEAELHRQNQDVTFGKELREYCDVWIILMRSGALFLSEKPGGAKLEFITPILHDNTVEELSSEVENLPYGHRGIKINGTGISKGRQLIITSKHKGAHYVFHKQFEELINDAIKVKESMEKLRKA